MKNAFNVKQKILVFTLGIALLAVLGNVGLIGFFFNEFESNSRILLIAAGMLLFLLVMMLLGSIWIRRAVIEPLTLLEQIIQQVRDGDLSARMPVTGDDEFGQLGVALNTMLDERHATELKHQQEYEELNNSVIGLLQTVAQLAQRNLTIKATVSEDVTGSVADALNMMTTETAKVLQGVTQISADLAKVSQNVKSQSNNVITVADKERSVVEETASTLDRAVETMSQIANLAKTSTQVADLALKTTETAVNIVSGTVDGINGIRDTIRETEKRIKRLGERSQEISGIVNLINNISERTHILALNASMHAASAGEAGRGFAVVADEVQRLAENAREATSQISGLVHNIQVETTDTVNTMNELITQVVSGSQLAEKAGLQMNETQKTTSQLVSMVQQIAKAARIQAHTNRDLLQQTQMIKESVQQTGQYLQEQSTYTDQLVDFANKLVNSVGVFKLPPALTQH